METSDDSEGADTSSGRLSACHRPIITSGGRFKNPWSTWSDSFWQLFKFMFISTNHSNIPSASKLNQTLPLVPVDPQVVATPPSDGIPITWLGHATVLVQFDGISVITDPVFSERSVSPFSFVGPKRCRPVPAEIRDLPPTLNAVVISHNHYNHLDIKTVQSLNARYGSKLHWFVPQGLKSWMRDRGCETVTELSWWEKSEHKDVKFMLTPAQHRCERSFFDTNRCLWGSWCILGPRHKFYFAGDTGYCEGFKQIDDHVGPFDVAAIPIGAYKPRGMMKPQHVDPKEAVQIHQDVCAQRSVGVHWGTVALAHEFYLEPPQKLKEESEAAGLQVDEFFVLKHGESKMVYKNVT